MPDFSEQVAPAATIWSPDNVDRIRRFGVGKFGVGYFGQGGILGGPTEFAEVTS